MGDLQHVCRPSNCFATNRLLLDNWLALPIELDVNNVSSMNQRLAANAIWRRTLLLRCLESADALRRGRAVLSRPQAKRIQGASRTGGHGPLALV